MEYLKQCGVLLTRANNTLEGNTRTEHSGPFVLSNRTVPPQAESGHTIIPPKRRYTGLGCN